MIPDPPNQNRNPFAAGGEGKPARGPSHDESRAGCVCWLCDRLIEDPPEIIGQYIAGHQKVAHRRCWQTLGEYELDFPPPAA